MIDIQEITTITYKGIDFRRYPHSKNRTDQVYFTCNSSYFKKGIRRLHTEVWKDVYGQIPDGYIIHHKDNNPLNNALSNLECLSREEHQSSHMKEYCENNKEKVKERMKDLWKLTLDWKKSDEGKEFYRKQARYFRSIIYNHVCIQCGKEYYNYKKTGKFCSDNCASKHRKLSGVDNEKRICEWCGNEYITNKYTKIRFCNRSCAMKHTRNKNK